MTIKFDYQTARIAAASALSGIIDIYGKGGSSAMVAIEMPAAWDAAGLTFQGSHESDSATATFKDVYDADGNEVTVSAAASRVILLVPSLFAGLRWLKVRSGTTGAPVNQSATRDLKVVVREV